MTTPWLSLRRVREGLSALLPALVVAWPALAWVREATVRASLTTLGRDQGIFQYIAWAVLRGDVDYRDVRDVNGPLTHLIHMVFLQLGGRDEHRFRVLDLCVTGVSFAVVGACLPGIRAKRAVSWASRMAWAFAGWVVLSAQYLMYLYWDLAQRESFFDWFMLPSVALQLVAQRGRARRLFVVVGALSAIPWFGKPTYAAFTVVQVITILIDREARRGLRPFLLGCALGAGAMLGFLWAYGDVGAFARITFVDVPAMYRFMMPRTASEILGLQWGGPPAAMALVTSAFIVALIWDGQIPRRALAVGLLPLVGFVSVLAQAKGFPYHFHPVTAALYMQWLFLVVWAWERFRDATWFPARVVPLAAAAALAARMASVLPTSPNVVDTWLLDKGSTAEQRQGEDYFTCFDNTDFFPWQMREAAAYLQQHTSPNDRVQLYGIDPYVLFLAERRSATPYIYAYDLNADAALAGAGAREGVHPTPEQMVRISELRGQHEAHMLDLLKGAPPAAFVFIDKAPLMTYADAVYDFDAHCPQAGEWVAQNYRETAVFGNDRIWLRNDLVTAARRSQRKSPYAIASTLDGTSGLRTGVHTEPAP